jgi:hypothetical protein
VIFELFNVVSNDIYSQKLVNEDLKDTLSKSFNTYVLNKVFDLSEEPKNDLIENLPLELFKYRKENNESFILNELNIKLSNSPLIDSTIELNNRDKSAEYQQMFIDSWRDLFIDNPELAEKLVQYSFITSGFQMNSTQFFTFIPFEYFVYNININNKLRKIFNESNFQDFVEKFYLNNANNGKIVKTLDKKRVKLLTESTLVKDENGQSVSKNIVTKDKIENAESGVELKSIIFQCF